MTTDMKYISHARTPEELKDEVLSDLRRRLAMLDSYINNIARSAAEKARLACAEKELMAMLQFWNEVEIVRPKRKRERERVDISSSVTLPHISTGQKQ